MKAMDRPTTSKEKRKLLDDLSVEELECLLQKNREIQLEVKATKHKLESELNKVILQRDHLEDEQRRSRESLSTSESASFYCQSVDSRWTATSPYFMDSSGFAPPLNRDSVKMKQKKYVTISNLRPAKKWNQDNMRHLDNAIKKHALRRLQTGLKEKKYHLMSQLDEKNSMQQMLNENNLLEDDVIETLLQKMASGRSIAELEEAIKDVEKEISAQAKEPLKKVLENEDYEHDWFVISAVEFKGIRSEAECKAMWKNCLHKGLARKAWTKEETNQLITLAFENNRSDWLKIAMELGDRRSAYQIFIHYQTQSNKIRNMWTLDEDNAIKAAISKYRMGNYIPFTYVATKIPGRNAKQIAQRWRCQLDPAISRGNFTSKEDILLIVCRLLKKMSFRQISERHLARTENQLRGRYFFLNQRKNLEEKDADGKLKLQLGKDFSFRDIKSNNIEKVVNKNLNAAKRNKLREELIESAGVPKKYIKTYEPQGRAARLKYRIVEDVAKDGKRTLNFEARAMRGRGAIQSDLEQTMVEMCFFTTFNYSSGRRKNINEDNALITAQRVRDLCQSLGAKLTLPEVEDFVEVDPKYATFMKQFRKLQIEEMPISSVIPPQHTNLIGYRSMLLDLEKLREQKLDTWEKVKEFCIDNLEVWDLMNLSKQQIKMNTKGFCQNLHLVPGDSVKPTVTIHLHNSACDGNSCSKTESNREEPNTINVCGGYQELYFIKQNDNANKPCLKMSIQEGAFPREVTSGNILHLEEKELPVPVVELVDDCDERISSEEAFKLWKSRFVALFMSPAVLHFFRAPVTQIVNLRDQADEQAELCVKKPTKRCRPKGSKHWKRIKKSLTEAEKSLKEPDKPKPEKQVKKRRTQQEMREMHAEKAQLAQRTSRRNATATSTS